MEFGGPIDVSLCSTGDVTTYANALATGTLQTATGSPSILDEHGQSRLLLAFLHSHGFCIFVGKTWRLTQRLVAGYVLSFV
jgi:hypothetical protein